MLKKVLVANRGEIALRVMRACRDLGIKSVAVYSEPDHTALHSRYADEAYLIGPGPAAESYLNFDKLIETALRAGADAVHPGYGFLSERAAFAEACAAAGLKFIGPSPRAMRDLGDKVVARIIAQAAGTPTVPGTPGHVTPEEARLVAQEMGYPLLIKAAAGGGGKGIRLVTSADELDDSLRVAASEALASFGDDTLYVEKYLDPVRHVEIQILADQHGNIVHLGERECSIQRRSQKLVEEAPSVAVSPELRERMGAAAVAIARQAAYENAGTVEFLLDRQGDFYFIEVNARLQVEHTITEIVTGIDLVRQQLLVASGKPLAFSQDDVNMRGCAIELRITAEDALHGFLPSNGRISYLNEPSGPGVRVDSSLFAGSEVTQFYDSLLAKLVIYGADRQETLARGRRALDEFQIGGVQTTLPFFRQLFANADFQAGNFETRFLERNFNLTQPGASGDDTHALTAATLLLHQARSGDDGKNRHSAWLSRARREEHNENGRGGRSWRATS